MEKNNLSINYSTTLADIKNLNSSFDTGVLRICYIGKNRNDTFISKEAIEKSLNSIYNCPIVCNYNRDNNSIGGHDIELVSDENGDCKVVNVTQPVGVIPESAKIWFEDFTEDDGTVNTYLCANALLWKRQEAYEKIKENGTTSHSMEISVIDGNFKDGIYYIEAFEFRAFVLLGDAKPCFESSALQLFSVDDLSNNILDMMNDLKENYYNIKFSEEVDIDKNQMKGGKKALDKIKDFEAEEIVTKPKNKEEKTVVEEESKFSLINNLYTEIEHKLSEIECVKPAWADPEGDIVIPRYYYLDYDVDAKEVYCRDGEDCNIYGFEVIISGDECSINLDSKTRMKQIFAPFVEAEQAPEPISVEDYNELKDKYDKTAADLFDMQKKYDTVLTEKKELENKIKQSEADEIFSKFADLSDMEEFKALKESAMDYSLKDLEDKCYSLRGRMISEVKFSHEEKMPKLKINRAEHDDEPYGGIVEKFSNKH